MLSDHDLRRVHEGGLQVLRRTGVVFRHRETLDLFASRGFAVDGSRVRMTSDQVQECLAAVPGSFVLEARNPERDLRFGGDGLVIATAAGPAFVVEGSETRPATDVDLCQSIRLAHTLPNVDMIGFPVEAGDVPVSTRYVHSVLRGLQFSDKPIEYAVSTAADLRVILEASEIIYGPSWHERRRAFVVVNSLSPLQYEGDTCAAILELAARGQPLCVTPCVMGGTTGPITLGGLLVQQHAETLAGIVLAQIVTPGCPVVYGGLSSVASMVSGDPLFGIPEFWALMIGTVGLARMLGLPCRAGAAVTDAHVLDVQAGIESGVGLSAVVLAGVNFVLHGTGIMSSFNALSLEKFVIDDELVGMLRAVRAGFSLDDESLALPVVDRVGPGGNYLLEPHTVEHCRDGARPSFFNRRKQSTWAQHGGNDLVTEATRQVQARLESYVEPSLDQSTLRQLERLATDR